MASFVLGVAGSAIGGPVGGFIGASIGSVFDSFLFGPGGRTREGPRLDDLRVTSSAYGKPIPLLYGQLRTGGNVDWSPGIIEHRQEETEGGKGGPSVTTVNFLYTASFGVTWAEGPASAI